MFKSSRNIYDVIIPLYYVSRLLGLAPLQLNFESNLLKSAVGLITYARLLLLVSIFTFSAIEIEEINLNMNIGGIAIRVELYLGCILTMTVLSLAIINHRNIMKILESLTELDESMKKSKIALSYRNARICIWIEVIGMTIIFFMKVVMQPFSYEGVMLMVYNVFNVVEYINTMMLYQYTNFILLIRQRYIWINRAIRELKMKIFILNNDMVNIKARTLSAYGITRYEKSINITDSVTAYAKMHATLHYISKLVNKTYGTQLFLTVVVRIIMIMTQMIYLYILVRDRFVSGLKYVVLSIYISLHLLKIFMILSLSENTAQKAQDTGYYLHQLWESSGETRDAIQFFSSQVIQQNSDFNARNFFVLNYSFMSAIISSITTYLVIIIQFDMAQTFNNKKC